MTASSCPPPIGLVRISNLGYFVSIHVFREGQREALTVASGDHFHFPRILRIFSKCCKICVIPFFPVRWFRLEKTWICKKFVYFVSFYFYSRQWVFPSFLRNKGLYLFRFPVAVVSVGSRLAFFLYVEKQLALDTALAAAASVPQGWLLVLKVLLLL